MYHMCLGCCGRMRMVHIVGGGSGHALGIVFVCVA